MEIESYEPYHIGIKLKPYVDLTNLKKQIKDKLKSNEYKISEDTQSGSFLPQIEHLGSKNDVDVVINMLTNAVNSIGKEPNDVLNIFDEVSTLIIDCGYEKDATFSFYEIITNVSIKTKKNPIEILNKSCNYDLKSFELNGNLNMLGIRLGDKLKTDATDFTEIVIEPKPTSPNNRVYIRIVHRTTKKEKIKNFHKSLEKNISKFIKQF